MTRVGSWATWKEDHLPKPGWTYDWNKCGQCPLFNPYAPAKLTYPFQKPLLKIIFLFQRWDILVPWRVCVWPFFGFKTISTASRFFEAGPNLEDIEFSRSNRFRGCLIRRNKFRFFRPRETKPADPGEMVYLPIHLLAICLLMVNVGQYHTWILWINGCFCFFGVSTRIMPTEYRLR